METNKTFIPHKPIHPFEILKDELKARDIRQKDFAKSLGMKDSNFSRLMKNKAPMTMQLALELEKQLGISCSFWMGLQEEYLRDLGRVKTENNQDAGLNSIMEHLASLREMYLNIGKELQIVERQVAEYVKLQG